MELLAPVGNIDKLKLAIHYGADAVYLASKRFGLRTFAGNFDMEELAWAVDFVHKAGKKIYITINIIPHDCDFDGLEDYIKDYVYTETLDDILPSWFFVDKIAATENLKAENVVKEDAAVNGDTVVIDFEGFIDDVAFEGGKGENYPLELGSNSFIPGFEEQLVGTKAGDSLDVNVTFPKDYHAELASKAAVFKVTVHEVKTKVVPELTDDFVKELEIEGVNTVDEYKKHVQAELNEHAKSHSDEKYTNDLVEKACANTNVNIPECMIEDYAKDMKASSERQAAQYNIPFEMYLQYMGYTLESFEKQAKEVAVKRIKADLVLSKIAEAEEIKVTPEELQAELKKIAEDNSMELAEVQKRVNLNQLAINLEQSKVIDVLKANAVAPAKKTKKAE